MPEDRTPLSHGLAHPQPERGRIPERKPQAEEEHQLVPNQDTHDDRLDPKKQDGVGGKTDFVQQPD